jgi:hypothetical protein
VGRHRRHCFGGTLTVDIDCVLGHAQSNGGLVELRVYVRLILQTEGHLALRSLICKSVTSMIPSWH